MNAATEYLVPPERYETPELVLRSYLPGDGAHLAEALNGSYEHLKRFLLWPKPHVSVEEAERRCREYRGRWLLASDFLLGIWAPDGSRLLGASGYHLRDGALATGNAEIGMWLRADATGRGLATAALSAMLTWGFSGWPWQRLSWRCSSANVASQRVAEKAGMACEGVLRYHERDGEGVRRDTLCFAALRGEWRPPER